MSQHPIRPSAVLPMLCALAFAFPAQAASPALDEIAPLVISAANVEDEAVLQDLRPDDVPVRSEEQSKPAAPEERKEESSEDIEQEQMKESGPEAE
jgi:hypothetical protein